MFVRVHFRRTRAARASSGLGALLAAAMLFAGTPALGQAPPRGDAPSRRETSSLERALAEEATLDAILRVALSANPDLAEALAARLTAAGWEPAGRGRSWYELRFVWRQEDAPPEQLEPAPVEAGR